jgi:hypothetical protein
LLLKATFSHVPFTPSARKCRSRPAAECQRNQKHLRMLVRCFLTLLTAVAAASLAAAQTPVITNISTVSTEQYQTIAITGSGFGTQASYTGDSAFISFEDVSANPGWQAGYSG